MEQQAKECGFRGLLMEKLLAGKIAWIRRKLHLVTEEKVSLKNSTDMDVGWDWTENCDGSKPVLVIELKRVSPKEEAPERGVL
jgi:hypothetical protein